MAAIPASSTTLSSVTEIRCSLPNAAGSGLSAAVASIEPIRPRSSAIRGVTKICEAVVSSIIATTQSAAGDAKLANVRIRSNRDARITNPHRIPSKCMLVSE